MLIAVLAAAFIGERMSLRRTIALLMGVQGRPGVIGATEPADLDDVPAGGASTKASMPRKRTWCAAVGVGDHRVGFAGCFGMQSGGDETVMIADDAVSASIT